MAMAASGGINVWGEFSGDTRNHFVEGLATFLMMAGWQMQERIKASVTGNVGVITNGASIQIGSIAYTWRTTINNQRQWDVKIGTTDILSVANLVSAINLSGSIGVAYSSACYPNPTVTASATGVSLTLKFKWGGAVGNGTPSSVGTLVGGGYRLRALAPQVTSSDATKNLQADAVLYDTGTPADNLGHVFANVRLQSTDPSGVALGTRKVRVVGSRRYQVVANRCQFFVFVPGIMTDNVSSVVSGGIPWVPDGSAQCGQEIAASGTDEIMWTNGDAGGGLTLRSHAMGYQSSAFGFFSDADAAYNGVAVSSGPDITGLAPGDFRPVGATTPTDYPSDLAGGEKILATPVFVDETPLLMEPFVGWAPIDKSHPAIIRGQLYDAWYGGKLAPLDLVVQGLDGTSSHFLNFSGDFLGAVWLLVPGLTPLQLEDLAASYAQDS